ncbi:MAG: diguanylate cyclase [Phycisphaerae bacterium]|nr:diguanylate cyclase [Phycisphaerae bacterium]
MAGDHTRVNQTILLIPGIALVGVFATACALHGINDWRRLRNAQAARTIVAAQLVAPQAGPLLLQREGSALHEWTREMQSRPGVRLVAVHDKAGQIRSIETKSPALAKKAVWSEGVMAGLYSPATWQIEGEDEQIVCGAMVPVFVSSEPAPVGQLTIAFDLKGSESPIASGLLKFYVPLLAVTVLTWWWTNSLLSKRILTPFALLCRRALRPDASLPLDREDQLGDMARAFHKLHEQIDRWRDEAQCLEVKLEKKLESQSRTHLKELREVSRQAELDPLTGLNNRRILDNHLDELVHEHNMQHADMSLIMIDIDNFKNFNDTLGHPAGDELLEFTGKLLRKSVRDRDMVVRLGGDEFAIVLPESTTKEAEAIARRLTALFGQFIKTLPPVRHPPSLSAGVASLYMTNARTGAELIRAADEALYRAKNAGKACVVVARESDAKVGKP